MGSTYADDQQEGEMDRSPNGDADTHKASVAQALESARADLQQTLAKLRQEKAWTDHLLESIVEGIVTLDRQGRITFFSQGAERTTGWQRDQVLGHACDQVFRPIGTSEPFTQLIPAPGGSRRIAVELRDGRQAMLAVTGARLLPPEGSNARVALVFRDVSEEEAVHRILGDFLANVAHEFRTPLSAVAASVELLLDQTPELTGVQTDPTSLRPLYGRGTGQADRLGAEAGPGVINAELHELLASLHAGILGLQTLVDNLLESASIETGHFRVYPRPSSMGEIIAEAIRMVQPLVDKHGQQLVIELPAAMPTVQADPRRMAQVLVNLLSNAIKHSPDNAEIGILVSRDGDRVRVTITDQGPGIPTEERNVLFRRFAHPSTGHDPAKAGAGLGLSVVKAVVEAHGGQVGIEDRPGGGVAFWFALPAPAPSPEREPAVQCRGKRRRAGVTSSPRGQRSGRGTRTEP